MAARAAAASAAAEFAPGMAKSAPTDKDLWRQSMVLCRALSCPSAQTRPKVSCRLKRKGTPLEVARGAAARAARLGAQLAGNCHLPPYTDTLRPDPPLSLNPRDAATGGSRGTEVPVKLSCGKSAVMNRFMVMPAMHRECRQGGEDGEWEEGRVAIF